MSHTLETELHRLRAENEEARVMLETYRARIAELEARDLVCPDDVKRLTDALAFLGVSSPESLEESSARSGSLVRDLLDAIEEHRELFMRASRLRGGEG